MMKKGIIMATALATALALQSFPYLSRAAPQKSVYSQSEQSENELLDELYNGLVNRSWNVNRNLPEYDIKFLDNNGDTMYTYTGVSLIKPINPTMHWPNAIVSVNPENKTADIAFRNAYQPEMQLIFINTASEFSNRDFERLGEYLTDGELTVDFDSTTPVQRTSWGLIKSLYR